jgi:hypothetical protein
MNIIKVFVIGLTVVISACASNGIPKNPPTPKGKWYVVNAEQQAQLDAKKALKAKAN